MSGGRSLNGRKTGIQPWEWSFWTARTSGIMIRRREPPKRGISKAPRQLSGAWPLTWRLWQQGLRAANGRGKALSFTLTPGQTHDLPSAITLLEALPRRSRHVVWDRSSRPVIPPKRNEPSVACPKWAYRHRHLVENLWACLKEWRAVATRYEKTAASFISVICIAATADYLKT